MNEIICESKNKNYTEIIFCYLLFVIIALYSVVN